MNFLWQIDTKKINTVDSNFRREEKRLRGLIIRQASKFCKAIYYRKIKSQCPNIGKNKKSNYNHKIDKFNIKDFLQTLLN